MRLLAFLGAIAFFSVAVAKEIAPPLFGVPAGTPPDDPIFSDFSPIEGLNPGIAALAGRNPPAPHSAFSQYAFQFHPSSGVCWGQALSDWNDSDRYGGQVRSAIARVVPQLSTRYGEPKKVDLLHRGSIWDRAEHWTTALAQNERFYNFTWSDLEAGNSIIQIFLTAQARSNRTRMVLEWSFENYEACQSVGESVDMEAF